MSAIIRVRNQDGNIIEVPAFVGPQGASALITNATASIDNTSGEPTVTVSLGGTELARTFDFAFTGLKGEKGEKGDDSDVSIVTTTEDPGAGAVVDYPDRTVIHVYE